METTEIFQPAVDEAVPATVEQTDDTAHTEESQIAAGEGVILQTSVAAEAGRVVVEVDLDHMPDPRVRGGRGAALIAAMTLLPALSTGGVSGSTGGPKWFHEE